MNPGMQLVVYPVKDLARAKAIYSTLLGKEPYFENAYYAGYRIGHQEIGLDPNGHQAGMTGPVVYWQVRDIDQALQGLVDSGARTQREVKDVGGGKRMATVKDIDGNLIGLVQG